MHEITTSVAVARSTLAKHSPSAGPSAIASSYRNAASCGFGGTGPACFFCPKPLDVVQTNHQVQFRTDSGSMPHPDLTNVIGGGQRGQSSQQDSAESYTSRGFTRGNAPSAAPATIVLMPRKL